MRTVLSFLQSLRFHQWIKNLLIFAALIFSRNLGDGAMCLKTLLAFLAFCFLSSGVYIVNDLLDMKRDRLHPEKKSRPIASGRLKPPAAVAGSLLLLIAAALLGMLVHGGNLFMGVLAAYFLMNLVYSIALKKMVVADVLLIAVGFLLRVTAGGLAIGVEVSYWLIMCTFFGAAMLACCKRRAELANLGESGEARAVLADYTLPLLDIFIAISATAALMAYALYTVSERTLAVMGTANLIYTLPVVMYGICRYLFLVYRRREGEDPAAALMKDFGMIAAILIWLLMAFLFVYQAKGG